MMINSIWFRQRILTELFQKIINYSIVILLIDIFSIMLVVMLRKVNLFLQFQNSK